MRIFNANKAFMPILVTVVLAVLAQMGITSDMTVEQVVSLVVTAGLVYFVPNKR